MFALWGSPKHPMSKPLDIPSVEELTACSSAGEIRSRAIARLAEAQTILDGILSVRALRTRANTLDPINLLSLHAGGLRSALSCLRSVHPSEETRRVAEESEKQVSSFGTQLRLNPDLYRAVRQCDPATLDSKGQRFLKHLLRDFHRDGVDRDEATRERVRALRDELVSIGQDFHRNILKDTGSIELESPDELAGLPADYIREHPPGPNGKVRITTDYPDYSPFMTYAESDARRRELYTEFRRRAYPENLDVLKRLMARRHELATLLGYPSWAAYAAEDKMIKTPEAIAGFIDRVSRATESRAVDEYDDLLQQKRKQDPGAVEVFDWEKSRLEDSIRAERFQVDSREIRSYFEYTRVKEGILALIEHLFGVQFVPDAQTVRWHPDVEVYQVHEAGSTVGRVYLDMHPREGKFKHAAMFPLVRGVKGLCVPEAALVCNFPNPRTTQGPALLEHDDVLTFFHELGHLLHQLFAWDEEWSRFSGVSNEWDFIEVPSQLFEEWGWDPDVLQRFAVHPETRRAISADLVDRMRKAKAFGRSLWARHQMFYAAVSLKCFGPEAPWLDTNRVVEECQERHALFRFVPNTYFQASFGHLDDYSALYYTYMWSLVIEKDVHDAWRESGLMSPAAAARYRDQLLRPGSSLDAVDLLRGFLGRDYEIKAFEEWLDQG